MHMKADEIRSKFFDFFISKAHQRVPSAPIINKSDPTLLFTNAGMNPFKAYFLGRAKAPYPRLVNTQKCLRVSGKHNDLEAVGGDTYHHTLFEMLGNWSFGDYFKKEAIEWAWEFLTKAVKIDTASIYATVFGGDRGDGLGADEAALSHWRRILPADRILFGDKRDNFWEMGDQGPCGPSSEIHVDIRSAAEKEQISGAEWINKGHPEVIEIWNLVFVEFNRKASGELEPLAQKYIDTGMGLERLLMVLEGVQSTYDTTIFIPIIREIEALTGVRYRCGEATDKAIRVVADHLRAVSFSIADGQLPSRSGAGYVIRRILRRAVRYGFTFLDQKEPFIHELVKVLAREMGEAFPELRAQQGSIEKVVEEEERAFLRTLEQGLCLLDALVAGAKTQTINGQKVFELYDTYGFPKDLTALILREKGFTLDESGFQEAMKRQRQRSREARVAKTSDWIAHQPELQTEFLGYDHLKLKTRITRYRRVETQNTKRYQLVLQQTPFYPEGGGQLGDRGYLETRSGERIPVLDTQKEHDLIVHYTESLPKDLTGELLAVVDEAARKSTAANHSATHLLHQALRVVLGAHVAQKGSWVSPAHLRFDFSHFSKLTRGELDQVEAFVNARIRDDLKCEENRSVPFEAALAQGAIAFFGEKYGDRVRSIRFGDSIELCGGTHVSHSGCIWRFKIVSESAVASGVRRIEAITGQLAERYFLDLQAQVQAIKDLVKNQRDPLKSIQNLQRENRALKKQLAAVVESQVKSLKADLVNNAVSIQGTRVIVARTDLDAAAMKDLAFELRNELPSLCLALGSDRGGKALLAVACSDDWVEKGFHAGRMVREWAKAIKGGGGGQPFFATAGGSDPKGLTAALEKAKAHFLQIRGA